MKKTNMKVHFWEIRGFIKIQNEFGRLIKVKILEKFGSLNSAAKQLKLDRGYFNRVSNSYLNTKSLLKIADSIGLTKEDIEKYTIGFKDNKNGREYNIRFPFLITPLYFRCISHIIGDGTIGKSARWSQKNIIWLEKLIRKSLNIEPHIYERKNMSLLTIPFFIVKMICVILKIKFEDLKSYKFLDACISLPKDYKVEVLSALIVDEGNINKTTISIRMSDKNIVESIGKLIDSLDYNRSDVKINKCHYKGLVYNMYAVHILGLGLLMYFNDLSKLAQKYGNECELWNKQDTFLRRIQTLNISFLLSRKQNEELIETIKTLIKENPMRVMEISRKLNIDYHVIHSLLSRLMKLNIAKKLYKGVYIYEGGEKNKGGNVLSEAQKQCSPM